MGLRKDNVTEAVTAVRERLCAAAEIGVVLGSGLGAFADGLDERAALPYFEIPHFAPSSVAGHAGRLVTGIVGGKQLIVQQGRHHLYEGHGFEQILLPIRVMYELGVKTLIVTNAAGGVNADFGAGDLMLITNHINLMGTNPLIGLNDDTGGPRFPDMLDAYDSGLRRLALEAAGVLGVELKQGVYLAVTGPSYETAAEVLAFRALGADAVGMSTVPEVIYSRYLGLRTLGFSVIANMAVGLSNQPLSHDEVIRTVAAQGERIAKLIRAVASRLDSP
ncbi:MAG: purine-nucleoside phosphorylase [Verrucomicrobia bacterium]|nr:purine-nucleoside phosphorylase [Verrucomicrobiota bacterium]